MRRVLADGGWLAVQVGGFRGIGTHRQDAGHFRQLSGYFTVEYEHGYQGKHAKTYEHIECEPP